MSDTNEPVDLGITDLTSLVAFLREQSVKSTNRSKKATVHLDDKYLYWNGRAEAFTIAADLAETLKNV